MLLFFFIKSTVCSGFQADYFQKFLQFCCTTMCIIIHCCLPHCHCLLLRLTFRKAIGFEMCLCTVYIWKWFANNAGKNIEYPMQLTCLENPNEKLRNFCMNLYLLWSMSGKRNCHTLSKYVVTLTNNYFSALLPKQPGMSATKPFKLWVEWVLWKIRAWNVYSEIWEFLGYLKGAMTF